VKAVVVGGGAWGSAFSNLLRSRGHEVTLAVRATLDEAPYEDAELVVIAVPSSAFRDVLGHVRGAAPILSLVKGLDPASGECTAARSRSCPGRTTPRRWRRDCLARP
jgi:glycerol-3-phosphate dehydrogenase